MTALSAAALIAIDWGTTSFRAWALDAQGQVLRSTSGDQGILSVRDGDFEASLEQALTRLDDRTIAIQVPLIAAGMITSRNGWVETPYLPLPLDAAALAGALSPHQTSRGRRIHFVTGASSDMDGDFPDVMRGEETEVIGQVASDQAGQRQTAGQRLFVLPGTHSKWVRVTAGKITAFQTCMTGEAFAVLRDHSILGRLMDAGAQTGADPGAAFERGLAAGRGEGALMARAFSARSLALAGSLAPGEIADYLSGLLIGDEIRAGLAQGMGLAGGADQAVTIIGRGDLAERYARAFAAFGIAAAIAPQGMNRRGLFEIATKAGLIG
ncbi:2-dehydro-3-deoxygalactonokinase [Xinfangfangia sp. D13-10-4-6]|uniref:2-dehydro-3-deoxygalactonokinase n=1 Tax=Pseudogemmobacter hezensis TaxID=2737662 RepID=UPI001551F8AC|nr:2-dehydro-3-deoxygalactonokinase [Pseudogemmobacter hezensis]NPD16390.1 2-dehydro-3-deoxygalactonokinase [Pseudogemmobacter hezensis]